MYQFNYQFNEDERIKITTKAGNSYFGRVVDIEGSDDEGYTGVWMVDNYLNNENYFDFTEVEQIQLLEETPIEKMLRGKIGKGNYTVLEGLADEYKTAVENIVLAFVNDLAKSDNSGGSDERELADRWFYRNCVSGVFRR